MTQSSATDQHITW